MEKTMKKIVNAEEAAHEISFTSLINSYCRECSNWSRYQGIPRYDATLAGYIRSTGHTLHLRIDFSSIGSEVYIPLQYFAETGLHAYHFPAVERTLEQDVIHPVDATRFITLVTDYIQKEYPEAKAARTTHLMQNSIHHLHQFIEQAQVHRRGIDEAEQTFIEAEQSLILGHPLHPLAKTREGFTEEDWLLYSPETAAQFQLYYFLIDPALVQEKTTEAILPTEHLRNEILKGSLTKEVRTMILEHPQWKIVPVHPWEANYLLEQPEVNAMRRAGALYPLGTLGSFFSATSSVRTVYAADHDYMYKLSLHVKITNSFRVNYPHELERGYDASRLMNTGWRAQVQTAYPDVTFITDPAYITVSWEGKVIDGFSTSVRQNIFSKERANANVSMLASLCQDAVPGYQARMVRIIHEAAERRQSSVEETARDWFAQYLQVCVRSLIGIFHDFGLGSEYHQQNVLLEMDEELFPTHIYFRDNQGFFFREGKVEQLQQLLPDFGANSRSFIPETRMYRYWDHYLISNHLFGLIHVFGKHGLATEISLIKMLYAFLQSLRTADSTGLVDHFLNSPKLHTKGNLLTSLLNMDEASAPRTNPAVYRTYPNPLHKYFFSEKLIHPNRTDIFYRRYFPKEDVTIGIRPVDLDNDLEMLHEWFNREHAIKIWQMNWPIRQLELYYRTLFPGDLLYAYIGEANEEPTFYFEVYWAIRDLVGAYYDVLPTDYGTHQFIAPVDPKKKYASPSTQCMVDYVFAQPECGRMVGEGSVDSLASLMNKIHVGFKVEKVIEMPHKKANLNFCYREWYWAKFPQNKNIRITSDPQLTSLNVI